ncbi:BRCA1-associated protein [Halotydeus destructor]|nr:BRCA1-associated protein [Halotydeus destructor]
MSSSKDFVLLGFTKSNHIIKDELNESQAWKVNKIGGSPIFSPRAKNEDIEKFRDVLICHTCKSKLKFLLQIYCPVDAKPDDRVIYIFSCLNSKCQSRKWLSVRVMTKPLESQTSGTKRNQDWLETDNDWGDDDDSKTTETLTELSSKEAVDTSPVMFEGFDAFTPFYLNVDEETNLMPAPTKLDHRVKELSDKNTVEEAETENKEGYEKVLMPGTDKVSHKFYKALTKFPGQLIRYSWTGSSLLNQSGVEVRPDKCDSCRGKCVFEMQLMPALVTWLKTKSTVDEASIDFGTVLIFSCEANCNRSTFNLSDCLAVDDPDEKIFKRKLSESSKSSKEPTPEATASKPSSSEPSVERTSLGESQVPFHSGNHFVEVTTGILHLHRESISLPLGEAARSELLCLLSVPASMTVHDLLQFTGPVADDVENMRIIKDNKPNQYMVLIKFRTQRSADDFFTTYNGKHFNSIEPEICHMAYVARVESFKEVNEPTSPLSAHGELPTCPVCLERMDEDVEGILTILCNHSFHGNCLDKWGDTSCPVCRYSQTPEPIADNICLDCGVFQDSLWICIVCGHVGCGRYVEGHAFKHYVETQHTYAMQVGMNDCVWDYAADNYVHRLLQNNSDGKVVEVECNTTQRASEEKMEAVQLEYTYLLTNQLEIQRHHYEKRINRITADAQREIEEIKDKNSNDHEQHDKVNARVQLLTKEKQAHEKKISNLTTRMSKVIADLQEEIEINKCLRQNQEGWQKKLDETEKRLKQVTEDKEKEVAELKDQVRDLMFFLEAQQKLQDVPEATREEIEGGQIVMSPSTSTAKPRSKGKRR